MSAQKPASFVEWWQNLPIPWLVGDATSKADATAQGTVLDQQVALIKAATKARMPGLGPSDALPFIGGDRQLEQGPAELEANFRTRLKTAWDDWARAGTALELLVQLYWTGFPGAVLVQQNGLAYSLSGAPTAGADPTSLLVITTLGTNPNLPGSPPWWSFDLNTKFCSRFAVLFPGPVLPVSFSTVASAVFDGSQDFVDVTWSNAFVNANYQTSFSLTTSDGTSPVIYLPIANVSRSGVRVSTTARFTGQVDLIAWQFGGNPYADPHPADLARLRRIVNRWRPAKATCVEVLAFTQGKTVGWPVRNVNDGGTVGPASIVSFSV